jgi:hypothetical protein
VGVSWSQSFEDREVAGRTITDESEFFDAEMADSFILLQLIRSS